MLIAALPSPEERTVVRIMPVVQQPQDLLHVTAPRGAGKRILVQVLQIAG